MKDGISRRNLVLGSPLLLASGSAAQVAGGRDRCFPHTEAPRGAPRTLSQSLESRIAGVISVFDHIPASEHAAIRRGDSRRDVGAYIQAALDAVAARPFAGAVLFPAGRYRLTRPLEVPLGASLIGEGKGSSRLHWNGSSHGITMLRPVNASTQSFNRIQGLWIENDGNSQARNFGVYDRGGTEWELRDCFITGWHHGIVLDQSEIVEIATTDVARCRKSGIWLVNGPDIAPGAGGGYTNRITIRNMQFNGCGDYSIIDDGGVDLVIRDCNYNHARIAHLRVAGRSKLLVDGGEWEAAPRNVIITADTEAAKRGVGQCGAVTLAHNDFTQPGGIAAIWIAASCASVTLLGNGFGNMGTPAALVQGVGNTSWFYSAGNVFYEHKAGPYLDGRAKVTHSVAELP